MTDTDLKTEDFTKYLRGACNIPLDGILFTISTWSELSTSDIVIMLL